MEITKHGISVGIERLDDEFYVTITAVGKLTHHDYEIITPMLEGAIEGVKHPKLRVLFDATEFEGWELRAAWDDFKLGLKHGREFEKIAIYGNEGWQEWAAKIGTWFFPGDAKFFETYEEALEWLRE